MCEIAVYFRWLGTKIVRYMGRYLDFRYIDKIDAQKDKHIWDIHK